MRPRYDVQIWEINFDVGNFWMFIAAELEAKGINSRSTKRMMEVDIWGCGASDSK